MRLAIVVLNYRTPKLVIDCLASLESQMQPDIKVLVVDNYSGDNSVELIEQAIQEHNWHSWATLIASPVNGGFAAGNNVGMKALEADNYLLLNSDTIVREGAIAHLLAALDAYPEAGLIGPRLEWPDATPQISCFRYHSPYSELIGAAGTSFVTKAFLNYDIPIPVSDTVIEGQWISFACVLIRSVVIKQIGLMDEGYFMYYEDVDYCRRAKEAGWKIIYYPTARVVHLRGGSNSVKSDVANRKRPPAYLYASRSRYFAKFYGTVGLFLANLFWLLGRSISWVRELFKNKQPHTCQYQAQDIWMNWQKPFKTPSLNKN